MQPRIAFSTLAFPDASLATAVSLGRKWGYDGVELRLIDGELIDPSMPAAARAAVKRTAAAAGLPIVAGDTSIRLPGEDPGPQLRRFLELASDWESPLVRVFGGPLAAEDPARTAQLQAAARALEASVPVSERLGVAVGGGGSQGGSGRGGTAPPRIAGASAPPRPTPPSRAASCSRRSRTPGAP